MYYLFLLLVAANVAVGGNEEEFCISDVFQPRCQDTDEVIVINEAHFGRKKIGKCLKDEETLDGINVEDKRFLGCYSDVKHLISRKCSGKSFCEVRVAELPPPKPCFNFLRYYLGVSFKCIRMIQDNRQCSLNLVNSEPHNLNVKPGVKCGSIGHPWLIEALAGQKIDATFIDLSKSDEDLEIAWSESKHCSVRLGYIYDKFSNSNTTICTSNLGNSSVLFKYQSMSNVLEVGFVSVEKEDLSELLVLNFRATGCSDLIPPGDTWIKRTENEATIGCYSTRLRWKLKCIGQRWIGVIGNCSYGHALVNDHPEKRLSMKVNSDQTTAIITIGTCGVVASFLIACTGIICIKKYHMISMAKSAQLNIKKSEYNYESHPFHANKILLGDVKDTLDNISTNFPNDCQRYYELDQAFTNKDLKVQN